MLTPSEEKILKRIGQAGLATKHELKNLFDGNPDASSSIIELATGNLLDRGFITRMNPIGSTCFIITQKGKKYLQGE